MRITGTQVNYYFICKRKLWLFSHGVECEHESDLVRQGREVHSWFYSRRQKDLEIDQTIVLDWFDKKRNVLHEVKKSKAMSVAHEWQVYYYLYYLKRLGAPIASAAGIEGIKAELDYPLRRQKVELYLSHEQERELSERILPEIEKLLNSEIPSYSRISACKKCSYAELCEI